MTNPNTSQPTVSLPRPRVQRILQLEANRNGGSFGAGDAPGGNVSRETLDPDRRPGSRREQRPPSQPGKKGGTGEDTSSANSREVLSQATTSSEGVVEEKIQSFVEVYNTPPFDVSKQAYLELCLVVAGLLDGNRSGRLSATRIYEALSSSTEKEIRSEEGLTSLCSVPETLVIKTEPYKKTLYEIGSVVEEARVAVKSSASVARQIGIATRKLCEDGLVQPIERCLRQESAGSQTVDDQHSREEATVTSGKGLSKESTLFTEESEEEKEDKGDREGKREEQEEEGAEKGRAVGYHLRPDALSSKSVSIAQNSRFDGAKQGIHSEQHGDFVDGKSEHHGDFPETNGKLTDRIADKGNLNDRLCGDRPPVENVGSKRDVQVPSSDAQARIKNRKPRWKPLPIPDELAERLLEWTPYLEEVPGHRAMVQYNLFGTHYNESRVKGLVLPWRRIARLYGDTPDMLRAKRPYSASDLIEWYRQSVDPEFATHPPDHRKGLARVIERSGIPSDVRKLANQTIREPERFDSWTWWISLESRNRRHREASVRKTRIKNVEVHSPAIEPPKPLSRIKEYLNGLPKSHFSHGGYGVKSRLPKAREAVRNSDWSSQKIEEESRKLYWMEHRPQPLYKFCDWFPRVKADSHNQLMNLSSDIRPFLYQERDIEGDLDKAHLSSYVPIAETFGFEVPELKAALRASLKEGNDLWRNLAQQFDQSVMQDPTARRTAAKPIYAAVYGSSKNNTRFEIIKTYGKQTGKTVTGEAVDPIFDHPVVEEIYSVRGKIRDRIEESQGLEDAFGRFIPLSKWDGEKKKENRWRGVLAYVNATYELALIWECFQEALREQKWAGEKKSRRPRFKIWLLQGDGFTLRVDRKRDPDSIIHRLQDRVKEKASKLGMITALSVEQRGAPE